MHVCTPKFSTQKMLPNDCIIHKSFKFYIQIIDTKTLKQMPYLVVKSTWLESLVTAPKILVWKYFAIPVNYVDNFGTVCKQKPVSKLLQANNWAVFA